MLSKKKKKKNNEKKIAIKLTLSLIYIIVITVLSVSAYQIFKEKLIPIFLNLLQKVKEEVTVPNSFYDTSITLNGLGNQGGRTSAGSSLY